MLNPAFIYLPILQEDIGGFSKWKYRKRTSISYINLRCFIFFFKGQHFRSINPFYIDYSNLTSLENIYLSQEHLLYASTYYRTAVCKKANSTEISNNLSTNHNTILQSQLQSSSVVGWKNNGRWELLSHRLSGTLAYESTFMSQEEVLGFRWCQAFLDRIKTWFSF